MDVETNLAECNEFARIKGNCISASDRGPVTVLTGCVGICLAEDGEATELLMKKGPVVLPGDMLALAGDADYKEDFR